MKSSQGVITNFLWRFLERCGAQGVAFVVSIILARLLEPDVYGTIALVTIFTSILQVFIDSGLGNALIQKKDADNLDFSSVFYFNIVMCIVLYIFIYILSPYIASFYEDTSLTQVIRVLSITLILSGIKNIQQAYVSRTMQFKRFFYATLSGTIGAAIIGIVLAYKGFGVWALVTQQVFNAFVDTVILWLTVKWRPEKAFSYKRLKSLLQFGWKLLISTLLNTVYNDIRQLIIGKMYSANDLAYYNRGKQFPNLVISNINTSIDSVLLPTMSKAQDNRIEVKNMTRRAIKTSTYIMAPLMMGLAGIATPFVKLILTEKWLPCVFFIRIFCISFMFYPIHTANLNAIKAMGRSDLYLKLELIKKGVGLIALFSTMWISVEAMAYSFLFTSIISQIINSWPNKKLLNYSYLDQLKDIMPSILLASLMGSVVMLLTNLSYSDWVIILIQVFVGALIYLLGSIVLKIDSFIYLTSKVKAFLGKR